MSCCLNCSVLCIYGDSAPRHTFSYFTQSSGVVAHNDLAAILHKDAVYNAVGLAAFDLYDEVKINFTVKKIKLSVLKTSM